MRIRFDGFELDEDRLSLARDGVAVALRPKVFDLLVLLVRERHRVVRREELVERLWSRTVVGPGSLAGLVNELRGALAAAAGGRSRAIRTVHARGYQFVAFVEVVEVVAAERSSTGANAGDHASAGRGLPIGSAGPRRLLDRLRGEVLASGPRALVCALADAAARVAWLAEVGGVALAAGFVVRSSVSTGALPGSGLVPPDRVPGPSSQEGPRGCEAGDAPGAGSADSTRRQPVCCLMEVEDPAAWLEAGGLRRLLDLAGRAPVLVIAALAAGPGEDWVARLVAGDVRVEPSEADRSGDAAVPDAAAPRSKLESVDRDGGAQVVPGRSELAERLRDWATVDRQSLEAVLRVLGFVAEPQSPGRRMRRAEPRIARGSRVAELGAG